MPARSGGNLGALDPGAVGVEIEVIPRFDGRVHVGDGDGNAVDGWSCCIRNGILRQGRGCRKDEREREERRPAGVAKPISELAESM